MNMKSNGSTDSPDLSFRCDVTVDDLRALLRIQPFSVFNLHLSDGRTFEVPHPDYLLIPPERSTIVFVFHKGGSWDIVYLKQITSVSGVGDPPALAGRRSESQEF
jgi:hypothetical protein